MAQLSLWFGAPRPRRNSAEERIYRAAGSDTPEAMSDRDPPADRAAGREPVERDTLTTLSRT